MPDRQLQLVAPQTRIGVLASICGLLIYAILADFSFRLYFYPPPAPDFAREAVAICFVSLPLATFGLFILGRNAQLMRKLNRMSRVDQLTNLLNRGAFDTDVRPRCDTPIGGGVLIVFDVDHFKRVNDTYGHPAGDAVLKQVASHLTHLQGPQDVLGRLGGEEFGLYCQSPSMSHLSRDCLELKAHLPHGAGTLLVTLSAGAVSVTEEMNFDQAMRKADKALYRAKSKGRACMSFDRAAPPAA